MNENLTRIVANLFTKKKGGEELSTRIHRIRAELKKVIEREDTLYSKFRELLESFREIVPDETQRHYAALKALSTTSRMNPQEVLNAINGHLDELKMLENVIMPALPGQGDRLKNLEARAQAINDEIARLRWHISQLEAEGQDVRNAIAAERHEAEIVEKAMRELFSEITADITSINRKITDAMAGSAAAHAPAVESRKTAEPAAAAVYPPPPPPPPPPVVPHPAPVKQEAAADTSRTNGVHGAVAPPPELRYRESQKRCPMCGGTMHPHSNDTRWRCMSCAFEEARTEPSSGSSRTWMIQPVAQQSQQDAGSHKKCPMCGGRMDYYGNENMFVCYSCAYESKEGDIPEASSGTAKRSSAPQGVVSADDFFGKPTPGAAPSAPHTFEAERGLMKGSIQDIDPEKHPQARKKNCPACKKKMNWHEDDRAWRCPYCEYERKI